MVTLHKRAGFLLLATLTLLGVSSLVGAQAQESTEITIVLPVEPQSLDPSLMVKTIEGQVMSRNIVETLTEKQPQDGVIIPLLAIAWEQIDDLTWRFHLREGVKFHDGTDFDAEDVVFSVERLHNPKMSAIQYFSGVEITGTAVDPYTVDIKSERSVPLMPTLMTFMPIVPTSTSVDDLIRDPVGTGPYALAAWDAGTQIVLQRFDGYWGEQPAVTKATYVWRQESSVRAAMVELGEADLAPDIAVEDANNPETDHAYLNASTVFLFINGQANPPFSDRRVRLALNYAINRDAILGSIVSKDSILSAQSAPPGTFGFNNDLKPWPYDPEKAKQLLAEAKADGVPVDTMITVPNRIGHFPGSEEVMEVVAAMLTDVGLNVTLRTVETGVFRADYTKRPFSTEPQVVAVAHDNSGGDAAFSVRNYFSCEGGLSRTCDAKLEEMISAAEVATGDDRRSRFEAIFAYIHDDLVASIDLYHSVAYARIGKRIEYTPSIATGTEVQLSDISFAGQ